MGVVVVVDGLVAPLDCDFKDVDIINWSTPMSRGPPPPLVTIAELRLPLLPLPTAVVDCRLSKLGLVFWLTLRSLLVKWLVVKLFVVIVVGQVQIKAVLLRLDRLFIDRFTLAVVLSLLLVLVVVVEDEYEFEVEVSEA